MPGCWPELVSANHRTIAMPCLSAKICAVRWPWTPEGIGLFELGCLPFLSEK